MSGGKGGALDRLVAEVRATAAGIAAARHPLRGTSTPASQRAALRLIGVNGLDQDGEPLAARVVERATAAGLAGSPDGTVLPLAGAGAAAGLEARDLALLVASGSVDLAAEDALLQDPARAALARQQLAAWRSEANERIDANRTARHELGDTLGWPPTPWIGGHVRGFGLDAALTEASALVGAGADGIVVRVPRGREWAAWGEGGEGRSHGELAPPPAGSQRGLARLRAALDELAAERGRSILLGTATDPLAAPEQALVSAFEGIDLVFADPFEEVAAGVPLARALADHAAAHELLRRSGVTLVLSAGPLLAGPELRRGEVIAAHTRIARSIAAQAVSVAWAEASALPSEGVIVEAPFEQLGSAGEMLLLTACILLRRKLHPGHPFALAEPADVGRRAWRAGLPVFLVAAGETRLIIGTSDGSDFAVRAGEARDAAAAAALLRDLLDAGRGEGPRFADTVLATAAEVAAEVLRTFEVAERDGWEALAGTEALTGMVPSGPTPAGMLIP